MTPTASRPHDYHPTVAIDFDGVLYPYRGPFTHDLPEPPIEGAVEWFNSLHPEFDRVIFSCRALDDRGRHAIRVWLKRHGLDEVLVTFKKPHADLYVDDRGYQFRGPGTYPTLEYIRSFQPWLTQEAK